MEVRPIALFLLTCSALFAESFKISSGIVNRLRPRALLEEERLFNKSADMGREIKELAYSDRSATANLLEKEMIIVSMVRSYRVRKSYHDQRELRDAYMLYILELLELETGALPSIDLKKKQYSRFLSGEDLVHIRKAAVKYYLNTSLQISYKAIDNKWQKRIERYLQKSSPENFQNILVDYHNSVRLAETLEEKRSLIHLQNCLRKILDHNRFRLILMVKYFYKYRESRTSQLKEIPAALP